MTAKEETLPNGTAAKAFERMPLPTNTGYEFAPAWALIVLIVFPSTTQFRYL
jgi:hypothetical protein